MGKHAENWRGENSEDSIIRFWAYQQAAQGLPIRNGGEARDAHRASAQRTGWKAGERRPVPMRLWTPLSSAAVATAADMMARGAITTF